MELASCVKKKYELRKMERREPLEENWNSKTPGNWL